MLSCDFQVLKSFFGTFAHNVANTWPRLHNTWHTTLFGTYYCVEVVKIENYRYMIEIMC